MNRFSISSILSIFAVICTIVISPQTAFPIELDTRPEILILHSYSPDYDWVRSEQRGLDMVLTPYSNQYKVRIEYMDTFHSPQITKTELLRKLYKNKFSRSRFSIIIATDNAALDFLKKYRDELFPGVPVIFCGINGYEDSMTAGLKGFTGIVEDNDFLGLFSLITQMQPSVKRLVIYGVADDPSHKANVAMIRKLLPQLRSGLAVEIRELKDIEACVRDAERLPQGSAILMVGSMRNEEGEGINLQRANEIMSVSVDLPIYTAWDFGLNHGAVGGLVVSGSEQGRMAAELALRVLKGEKADSIAVIRNATNVYMFDYNWLKRFDISLDRLPKGAIILNTPEAAYKISKTVIWAGSVFVLMLSVSVLILGLNIRRRKKAEASLAASEEKYSKAFRSSADVVGITRLSDGKYIEVSESFSRVFGYAREEIIGKASAAFGDEPPAGDAFGLWHDRDARADVFRLYREQGYIRDMEVVWCTRSGEPRTGLFSAEIATVAGEPCIVFVWHDITERKNSEREREDLQERLRQAQKMESIGLLAGGVAHDFNNLLTPILGYAEILLAGVSQDDPRYQSLSYIKHAARRSADLIQQLLAFSRRQMLELKTTDLGSVVRRFEHILRRTIREDIQINIVIPEDLWLVKADVGQVEQVLMNLAVNAQDAMPGVGTLSIELANVLLDDTYTESHPDTTTGAHVVLIVSDTGVGISKEQQEHLFEPFFTTKGRGKGTGLGLSTVYGIVKQHGGTISVYSEPGRGSSFKVYLPKGIHDEAAGSAEKEDLNDKLPGGSETILVVEDNEMVREIACEMLKMLGYMVIPAETPERSIEIFMECKEGVDLLLTDVIMPGMNGREVYNRMRIIKPSLKVLFMSGYTSNVIGHHGVLDDGMHLVQKPLSLHVLAEKIRDILDS